MTSMQDRPIRDRLDNWGRVMRVGQQQGKSMTGIFCESLAVRAGQRVHGNEGTAAPEPDENDALLVERAVRAIRPFARDLLRWLYVHNSKPAFICRRLSIRPSPSSFFDLARYHAEQEIAQALDRAANPEKIGDRLPIRLTASAATNGRAVAGRNEDDD